MLFLMAHLLSPCDAVETEKMMEALSKGIGGPAYLRINRNDLPLLTDPEEPYQIGKMNMRIQSMNNGQN